MFCYDHGMYVGKDLGSILKFALLFSSFRVKPGNTFAFVLQTDSMGLHHGLAFFQNSPSVVSDVRSFLQEFGQSGQRISIS